jgi:HNH endonuclease
MKFDGSNPPETVEFEGVIYRRMGGRRLYYLSQSTTNAGRRRAKGLHVAIWESRSKQSVPVGYEVHHKDGDTFNFDDDNLECLPRPVHQKIPKKLDMEAVRRNLDKQRPLASAWHRSPEGIEWHRQHAKQSIAKPGVKRPPAPIIGSGSCKWCGQTYQTKSKKRLFCSSVCQLQESAFRRGRQKLVHSHYLAAELRDGVQAAG